MTSQKVKATAFIILGIIGIVLAELLSSCAHQAVAPSTAQINRDTHQAQSSIGVAQKLNTGVGDDIEAAQSDADRIAAKGDVVLKYWGSAR